MIVTHPKLRSLHPEWAPFRGYSLIFCNASGSFFGDPATARAIDAIANVLDTIGRADLMRRSLLCLLPQQTYHVTFADLINQGNFDDVGGGIDMPNVLTELGAAPSFLGFLELSAVGVETFENRVVAIRLGPHRECDAALLCALSPRRSEMLVDLQKHTATVPRRWVPHMTLGYFAAPAYLGANPAIVDELREQLWRYLEPALNGQVFRYDMISYFRFESMVEFVRLAQKSKTVGSC